MKFRKNEYALMIVAAVGICGLVTIFKVLFLPPTNPSQAIPKPGPLVEIVAHNVQPCFTSAFWVMTSGSLPTIVDPSSVKWEIKGVESRTNGCDITVTKTRYFLANKYYWEVVVEQAGKRVRFCRTNLDTALRDADKLAMTGKLWEEVSEE